MRTATTLQVDQVNQAQDHECPMCRSGDLSLDISNVRDRLGFVNGEFSFFRCHQCQSVSLQPLPEEHEIAGFYPDSYKVEGPPQSGTLSAQLEMLTWRLLHEPMYKSGAASVVALTGLQSGDVLEIGCSSGYQLIEFAKQGAFQVTGVDLDGAAAAHARIDLGLNVIGQSVLEAGLPSSSFDLVILFNVLEHLVNPIEVLEEVRRLLRPGGFLAIKTQMIDSFQGRLFRRRWLPIAEVPRHVHLPSEEGIRRLMSLANLKLTGQRGGPTVENCIHIALSILPTATSALAFRKSNRLARYLTRLAGIGLSLIVVPFALIERFIGSQGTMIFVAQKELVVEGSREIDRPEANAR